MNAEQASEIATQEPTRRHFGEGRCRWESVSDSYSIGPAGVVATACKQREPDATREAPAVIAVEDQPAPRESQAGPLGVAERLVVLMKPGNAGRGKGPQLKGNARSDEDGGIGDESNNPSKRSEVADGVARKSEGIAQPSFSRSVGQGVSARRFGVCLRMLQSQRWSSRG